MHSIGVVCLGLDWAGLDIGRVAAELHAPYKSFEDR